MVLSIKKSHTLAALLVADTAVACKSSSYYVCVEREKDGDFEKGPSCYRASGSNWQKSFGMHKSIAGALRALDKNNPKKDWIDGSINDKNKFFTKLSDLTHEDADALLLDVRAMRQLEHPKEGKDEKKEDKSTPSVTINVTQANQNQQLTANQLTSMQQLEKENTKLAGELNTREEKRQQRLEKLQAEMDRVKEEDDKEKEQDKQRYTDFMAGAEKQADALRLNKPEASDIDENEGRRSSENEKEGTTVDISHEKVETTKTTTTATIQKNQFEDSD